MEPSFHACTLMEFNNAGYITKFPEYSGSIVQEQKHL